MNLALRSACTLMIVVGYILYVLPAVIWLLNQPNTEAVVFAIALLFATIMLSGHGIVRIWETTE